jgi:WhiB family transcriptional regulator, redox-sensing transcriptional regulator
MAVWLLQYKHIARGEPSTRTATPGVNQVQYQRPVNEVECARDPDRWTTDADEGAKALCRECPRRWPCAQEACMTPGAEGVWAGIHIPESGRARRFALKQLRSLAELNGYPVRKTG